MTDKYRKVATGGQPTALCHIRIWPKKCANRRAVDPWLPGKFLITIIRYLNSTKHQIDEDFIEHIYINSYISSWLVGKFLQYLLQCLYRKCIIWLFQISNFKSTSISKHFDILNMFPQTKIKMFVSKTI